MYQYTAVTDLPTRVAVGSQSLPFSMLLLLIILAYTAFAFLIFAALRPEETFWWLLSGITVAVVCVCWGAFAYERRNWDRTPHLELGNGLIAFVPSRRMRQMGNKRAESPYPTGCTLEYHIETGDMYFTGDHSQSLNASLWIAEPNGMKRQLLNHVPGVRPETMATNLSAAEISFRVVKIYDGQTGEHVESDVTAHYAQASHNAPKRTALGIFIGTSNLWLGVISAVLFHRVEPVVAIGVIGYSVIAIATLRSKTSKRAALVQAATTIPLYAAGYALAVVAVWYLFRR